MPMQLRNFATVDEPAAKKIKLGISVQSKETVWFPTIDGKKAEYCPCIGTSKDYDGTRAPLGLNIALGSMALSETPLHEQSILDISCGTGTFLGAVKGKVASVAGLEYNDGMIAQAKTLLGDSVKLVQGSADALTEFADASVDFCTMDQVFMVHHFSSDDNYAFCACSFQETYRVLKPGGVFVLNTSMPEQQRDAFWWLWYLEHGVKAGFMLEHRAGDSSGSMAENFGELHGGLKKLQGMIDADNADYWLEGCEQLGRSMGQATFVTLRKPSKLRGSFALRHPSGVACPDFGS